MGGLDARFLLSPKGLNCAKWVRSLTTLSTPHFGSPLADIVTGKRFWAHGAHGDADPTDPPVIYWFQLVRHKDKTVDFVPHLIDDDSGVGTQFEVADINGDGLLDIIVSNKKGVRVIVQQRTKQ